MAVLFGDGGGAVILEPNESGDGRGILSTHLFADGRFVSDLWMEKPSCKDKPTSREIFIAEKKFFAHMDGKNVFKNASERMPEAVMAGLEHNGLTVDDIDFLIPHQANDRICQMVAQGLKIPVKKSSATSTATGTRRRRPSPSPWTRPSRTAASGRAISSP